MKRYIAIAVVCVVWSAGFGVGHFVGRKSERTPPAPERLYDLVHPDPVKDKLWVYQYRISRAECDRQRNLWGAGYFCISAAYPEDTP